MAEVHAVESRVEAVTVFARGARVRRTATVAAAVRGRVRFVGLPVGVIADTVRAEVEGTAVVTMLRVGVDIPDGEIESEERAEVAAARRRVALADAELERTQLALERVAEASVVEDDPSEEAPASWQAVVAARRALVALRADRELALREQHAAARHEQAEARRALEVAVERDHQAGTARAARLHEVRPYVELELSPGEGDGEGDAVIHVEYQVEAARWAPSYVVRLGDDGAASFELRAIVAHNSGEDWTGVALRVSTAEPDRFAELPELSPQKIGRRQAEPARRGFRAPPAGADQLYSDYDRGFPRAHAVAPQEEFDDSTYEGRPPSPPTLQFDPEMPQAELADEVWDEETSRARDMPKSMPRGRAMPAPGAMMPMQAMPAAMASRKSGGVANAIAGVVAAPFALAAAGAAGLMKKEASFGGGGGEEQRQQRHELAMPARRLDYGDLVMAPPSSRERGRLVPAPRPDFARAEAVAAAIAAIERLVLPPGHVGEWIHTYDYAFASDGKVDVASDGAWHSIALTKRAGSVRVRHVAVPREQADVFRVAVIANPLDGPLLPGPIDVYDHGQFLVTSDVDYTPPGGTVEIGLGVDAAVKIARNSEFHEEAAGMLRGALRLVHAVTIDVENLSARPVQVEVRERIPVTREGEDDIEVTLGKVEPAWERWAPEPDAPRAARLRGGYRWSVELAPRAKRQLHAGYEVKIASKNELVGGNRREP